MVHVLDQEVEAKGPQEHKLNNMLKHDDIHKLFNACQMNISTKCLCKLKVEHIN